MKVTTVVSFAELALRKGLVSKESLQEALLLHAAASRRKKNVSVGDVMVRSGFLTSEQVREIEHEEQEILRAQSQADLPEEAAAAMQLPANRIGKFVKLQLVGRGGLGEVWRAYDLVIRRTVAIKFLHTMTPEHWQRFVKEAQILGRLKHPNIVPLYEIGDKFIVMPYIAGQTPDRMKLTHAQAAEIIRQAALALSHAHGQGVVHRDVKPSNIVVEGATAYVTDFGIAKELEVKESLSTTGAIVGTPAYMSPEQVRAREIDPRSDIYSLGATLYQLVSGRLPFCNEDLFEMMRAIQDDDPPKLDAPRDLEAVVRKAMEKSPAKRYRKATDMADDLARFLKGEPVLAHPSGTWSRVGRRLAKHKSMAVLGLVAVGGLAFGAYGLAGRTPEASPLQQSKYQYIKGQTVEPEPQMDIPQQPAQPAGQSSHQYSDRQAMRAVQAANTGNLDNSLASAQRAIEIDPKNPSGYYVLGRAHWQRGETDKALEAFRKYASFGPDYAKLVEPYLNPKK